MIGALREWLLSVTAAAILCALAQGLIPPGPVRRVGRLTAGLVMAAALLAASGGGTRAGAAAG